MTRRRPPAWLWLLLLLPLLALYPGEGHAHRPALSSLCLPAAEGAPLTEALAYASYRDGRALCFGPFATADIAAASRAVHDALADARVARFPRSRSAPEVWVTAPVAVEGLVPQIGFRRGRARDVVLVHIVDSFEGEPGVGKLFVLDGPTRRVVLLDAWDAVLADGECRLIYARGFSAFSEDGGRDRRELIADVAAASGLAPEEVARGAFEDGFTDASVHLAQPVVLDLTTGARRNFTFAGGGALGTLEGRVLAARRPRYWAFPEWDDEHREPIFGLNARTLAATQLSSEALVTARQHLARPYFRYSMIEERVPRQKGRSFARTGSGDLMLRVASATDGRGAHWHMQALRRRAAN